MYGCIEERMSTGRRIESRMVSGDYNHSTVLWVEFSRYTKRTPKPQHQLKDTIACRVSPHRRRGLTRLFFGHVIDLLTQTD